MPSLVQQSAAPLQSDHWLQYPCLLQIPNCFWWRGEGGLGNQTNTQQMDLLVDGLWPMGYGLCPIQSLCLF